MFKGSTIISIILVIGIMFLIPVVKSIPYASVALWILGMGIIIMAFIQTIIDQIKSNKTN